MDNTEIKTSPIKNLLNKAKANRNLFVTKIKILKQLKANGHDINIDLIQKVFDINIIKTNPNKSKKSKFSKNINNNFNIYQEKNKEIKKKISFNINKQLISSSYLVLVLTANFIISNLLFGFNNNIEFNTLNEQLISTINRTVLSPQTEVLLKSKFDKKTNSIVYFYHIIDNLDSYDYYIKNTSLNDELRVKLLDKMTSECKEIKNIQTINMSNVNSISLFGDSYIIDNKYIIKDTNVSGREINAITSSIKDNNIKKYNDNKNSFIISSSITLIILESIALIFIQKHKTKKDA